MANPFETFASRVLASIGDEELAKVDVYVPDVLGANVSVFDQARVQSIDPENDQDYFVTDNELAGLDRTLAAPDGGVLPARERAHAEGAVRERGFDALAFYKSYRYRSVAPFRAKWGVFVFDFGVELLANLMREHYRVRTRSRFHALTILFAHELYHFKFDASTFYVEALVNRPRYSPYRAHYAASQSSCPEEALANRHALEALRTAAVRQFARDYMSCQPGMYARFADPPEAFRDQLAANVVDSDFATTARRPDAGHWMAIGPPDLVAREHCPVWLVCELRPSVIWPGALIFPSVADVTESKPVATRLARDAQLSKRWRQTKKKLREAPNRPGLNFKPWTPPPGSWSVRVDNNFRAHLRQTDPVRGIWEVFEVGSHADLGHG